MLVLDPIDLYGGKNTMEVNGVHQLFGYNTDILQNIFVCVQQKRKFI